MMLQLLHGPAVNNSRTKLSVLRQKFDTNNVIFFDEGSKIDEILGSLMTSSLFPEEKIFILENPDESFSDYTLYPTTLPAGPLRREASRQVYTLVFWFDHTVGDKKPVMEWVKKQKGEILFFPESREVSVFPFLDYLANKDMKAFLEIKKLKQGGLPARLAAKRAGRQGFDIFYFITMTFYLLRNLVSTPKNAPTFVKQKLDRQRKNFDLEKLKKLYKEILDLDFKLKSGLIEKDQAEFLLVNKFIG